jgi:hypothetical protein
LTVTAGGVVSIVQVAVPLPLPALPAGSLTAAVDTVSV